MKKIYSLFLRSTIIVFAMMATTNYIFSQSGVKWATNLNSCSGNDAFGTSNNFWIAFMTNNTAHMWLTPSGNLGLGISNPVYKFDVNGRAHYSGNVIADSSITAMNLYAIQKVSADALQVNNNALFSGTAVYGNKITIDGNNSSISSNTGNIDFQNTNLTTTGNLNAFNLNLTSLQGTGKMLLQADSTGKLIPFAFPDNSDLVLHGNGQWGSLPQKSPWVADSIGIYPDSTLTNTNVFVKSLYASNSVSIGTFRFKNGLPSERDSISAEKRITIYAPSKIELYTDTLTMKSNVGIGVAQPQSALDVAGDINTSGTVYANNLYAQNSIAIGTLKISNGAPGSGKDSISSPYKLALVSAGREISLISDTVKIGDYNSTVRFDVNGSVRVRDFLRVENGIIVGRKFEGDTVSSERSITKNVEAVSVTADTVSSAMSRADTAFTQKLLVAGDARIDGNLSVSTLNTSNMNVSGTTTMDKIITKRITSPDSLIHFGDSSILFNHFAHSIFTLGKTIAGQPLRVFDLYIQNQQSPFQIGFTNNTILNQHIGNVGIGTSTPQATLHVNGTFQLQDGTQQAGFVLVSNANGLASWSPPVAVVSDGDWYFSGNDIINANTEHVIVGVEQLQPTSPHYLNYKMSVDGKLLAKKLIATELYWADDEFDKTLTFEDLEKEELFSEKNKHLMGIPSEKELKQTGLDLAEMSALQMCKIEQIYMYLFLLKKENEDLKKEIEILKANRK